jgi:predicted nucleic acid-binding protein
MNLVADTGVWIDFYRNSTSLQANILEDAIRKDRVLVPDLVLAEVLRGVASDKAATAVERQFEDFTLVQITSKPLAITAARNYRYLRSVGVTVRGTIDMLIGTWCIENKVPLLHNDRDYASMEKHLGLMSYSKRLPN